MCSMSSMLGCAPRRHLLNFSIALLTSWMSTPRPLACCSKTAFRLTSIMNLAIGDICCSVLQCVVVCCSVLQCVAVCCSVLQCVAVCCSVLQCVAVCCSVLQCVYHELGYW